MALSGPGCTASGKLRKTRFAKRYLRNIGQMLKGLMMSKQSEGTTLEQLTLFAEDSLAKTSAKLEAEQGYTVKEVDFGLNLGASLASYDPNTSSWKTSQICLFGDLAPFSENWQKSGMMRNGRYYQQPRLTSRTFEREFLLLPTPAAQHRGLGGSHNTEKLKRLIGRDFYHPTEAEKIMGFPIGWTDLEASETP